jgi:hypothetical protein
VQSSATQNSEVYIQKAKLYVPNTGVEKPTALSAARALVLNINVLIADVKNLNFQNIKIQYKGERAIAAKVLTQLNSPKVHYLPSLKYTKYCANYIVCLNSLI